MAVGRQFNWRGQQRIDTPHLRMIESAVAYDFDVLGGVILAGKVPTVVHGFAALRAGAVGNGAESLIVRTAGSTLIHYEATDAGSVFKVPDDRVDEVLSPVNPRVVGSFTPGVTNFVGLDLVRSVDDSTADTVKFLVPETDSEVSRITPLARTLDYRIVVSTVEFSATPGIAPLYQVITDASNRVTDLIDARWLMFRLGAGGSAPSAVSPFGWPGGRDESIAALADVGGDRSIFSLKEWLAAAMTRIWEVGGGEYWYSLTADRNVKMSAANPANIDVSPEAFIWDGTDLLWAVQTFNFDNSNGLVNEIDGQLTALAGLTNLADGECIYVDLDRTQDRTVGGANSLVPHKAPLRSLGGSARPGSRWVVAWRIGAKVFIRDQYIAVGESLRAATTVRLGTVQLTADPVDTGEIAKPKVVLGVMHSASAWAVAAGVSHMADAVTNGQFVAGPSPVQIGRARVGGDSNVVLYTQHQADQVIARGSSTNAFGIGIAALRVRQDDPGVDGSTNSITLDLEGVDSNDSFQYRTAHRFEIGGAMGWRNASQTPETPVPTAAAPIRSKTFFRSNGLTTPYTRDQYCVMWFDGSVTVIAEGPAY